MSFTNNLVAVPGLDSIPQLELLTPALGGPGGEMNAQAQALLNRLEYTRALANGIIARIKSVINYSGATVGTSGSINADGTSYSLTYPLSPADFTTPNDGITRNYKITVSTIATSLVITTGNGQLAVYTTTAGPTYVQLINMPFRVALTKVCTSEVVSLPPNSKIKLLYANNSTGANMVIASAQMIVEEFI